MGLFDKFLVLLGARSVIKTIEKRNWRTKSMSCRTSSMKWSDYNMKDLPILWLIFNTKIGRAIVCFILAGADHCPLPVGDCCGMDVG